MTTFDKTGREVHGMSWERHGHIMCKSRARDIDRSREGRMSWHGSRDNPVRVNWGLYLVQSTLSRLYFKNIYFYTRVLAPVLLPRSGLASIAHVLFPHRRCCYLSQVCYSGNTRGISRTFSIPTSTTEVPGRM